MNAVRAVLLGAIAVYRFALSPWIGRRCRFEPTCSAYAAEALERHGVGRGLLLALRRLGRCHPWGGHGYDPVPANAPAPTSADLAPTPAREPESRSPRMP